MKAKERKPLLEHDDLDMKIYNRESAEAIMKQGLKGWKWIDKPSKKDGSSNSGNNRKSKPTGEDQGEN